MPTFRRLGESAAVGLLLSVAAAASLAALRHCCHAILLRVLPSDDDVDGKDVGLPRPADEPPRPFTVEELSHFRGLPGSPTTDILISIRGTVFRVSPQFYGPGASYHVFAGTDASRNLGKGLLSGAESNADWSNLSPEHNQTLSQWDERFRSKYPIAGWLVADDAFRARGAAFSP